MKLRTKNGQKSGQPSGRKRKSPTMGQIAPSCPNGAKLFHAQATEPVAIAKAPAKPLGKSKALKHIGNMAPLKYSFDNRKATQAAAFILRQAGDKGISKGKLVKMLYAADRRQMKRIGKPITGDRLVAMEHGPVLSKILDYVDGDVVNAYWATYIEKANPHNHHVHLKADAPTDLLTEKEKEALTTAYEFFKDMSWDDVRNYCHKNFKEWTDPNGSSKAIDHEDLLRAAQKPASFIDEIRSQQQERILLKKIFA